MLSIKAQNITPSPTLAISAKAKQMRAEGIDVIGFGAGEPDFDTPEHIKKAAIRALEEGFTKYTPAAGIIELKKAICQKIKSDNGLEYKPEQIVISNGAKHSLTNIFATILNPEDEVIIPSPYWVSYPEIVKLNYGVPVIVKTLEKDKFKLNAKSFEQACTPKTRAVIINSPSNPTGQVYTLEELKAIASIAIKKGIHVVSDEVYEKIIFGNEKHISIATLGKEIKALTIMVNSVSKTYSMTGWRIGYTASISNIAKSMDSIQSHETSNPNSIAQKAAYAALIGPQDCVEKMRKAFEERKNYIVNRINAIPYISCIEPAGSFYLFIHLNEALNKSFNGNIIKNADDFASLLLDHYKISIVPGGGFGASDYFRLSFATSMENLQIGLERIEKFLTKLQ